MYPYQKVLAGRSDVRSISFYTVDQGSMVVETDLGVEIRRVAGYGRAYWLQMMTLLGVELLLRIPLAGSWWPLVTAVVLAWYLQQKFSLPIFGFRRLCRHHAAEHMVFNAYQAGSRMRLEEVRGFGMYSPHCGVPRTILSLPCTIVSLVLFRSVFIGTLVSNLIWMVLARRFSGIHGRFTRWVEKLVTAEPTDDDLYLAMTAMRELLPPWYGDPRFDNGTDPWEIGVSKVTSTSP